MEVKFKKRLVSSDVTAIRFVGKFLFAGIGGCLHIFDLESSKLLLTKDIFRGQKIHGIEIQNEHSISIFGGKMFARCEINSYGGQCSPKMVIGGVVRWTHSDWILHVKWLTDETVAVVTAHNNVSLHNSMGKMIAQATCQEKCIVYCALLVGSSWMDLVVLAGTVFQEVVVWTIQGSAGLCSENETSSCLDQPVMHRLKGHNGVIFSVSFDESSRILATTSDDRSVRSWRASPDWSHVTAMEVMFGHRARAWRGLACDGLIISVGEDGALCAWAEDGRLARRWDAHPGSRVWCVDFDTCTGLVATGGSDGGVCLWPLRSSLTADLGSSPLPFPPSYVPRRVRLLGSTLVVATEQGALLSRRIENAFVGAASLSTSLGSATLNIPSYSDGKITPLLTNIKITSSSQPNSTISENTVTDNTPSISNTQNNSSISSPWSTTYSSPRLASYSLLESSPSGHLVAVAAMDGWLAVFRCTGAGLALAAQANAAQGKVFSLCWVAEDAVLACADRGELTLFILVTEEDGKERLVPTRRLELPVAKEAWPTAAALFMGQLVCGDRAGNIHVFPLPEWRSIDDTVVAVVQTFPRLHGRLGVTCVRARGSRLWTGGRDGTVRQFVHCPAGAGLTLTAADKVPLPWIADFVDSGFGLLVLGFREVEFLVWSWTEQRTLLAIECGGGHRSWDVRLPIEEEFTFVHVKDKALHTLSCCLHKLIRPVLLMGFHSKEIGCVRLLKNLHGGIPLVVSSSEDTTIRFSRLSIELEPSQEQQTSTSCLLRPLLEGPQTEAKDTCHADGCKTKSYRPAEPGSTAKDDPGVLVMLATLRSHVSSVRALAFNSDQTLLFSAGGRAQLKVWSVGFDASGSLAVTERADHMLRERPQQPWREAQPAPDPETRYMDLCCLPAQEANMTTTTIAAGCSDGLLRFFTYDVTSTSLLLLQEASFHERCVLKVSWLTTPNSRHVLVSMATDGRCAFWAQSQTAAAAVSSKPFALLQLHQSGVNSVHWRPFQSESANGTYVFATGGDDNALVLTLLELAADDVVVLAQKRIESMHAAQITGVCFLNGFLMTACIDQRLRVWRWHATSGTESILDCTLAGQYTSTVSDIQGLHVWSVDSSRASALVHGKGLEVIDIDLT